MSQALIAPAYSELMALRKHFNLVYGIAALQYLLSAPTAAQLTAWLTTPANLEDYQKLISSSAGAGAVCASSGAMAAIAGSATAHERLYYSSAAAVANSKTAIDAVLAAGSAAISPMLAYSQMRLALYDNAPAFASLVATAEGKAALSAQAQLDHNTSATTHTYPPGVNATTRTVLISQKAASSSYTVYAGALADSYSTNSNIFVDRFARVTGLTHRTTNTSFISSVRYVVMQ